MFNIHSHTSPHLSCLTISAWSLLIGSSRLTGFWLQLLSMHRNVVYRPILMQFTISHHKNYYFSVFGLKAWNKIANVGSEDEQKGRFITIITELAIIYLLINQCVCVGYEKYNKRKLYCHTLVFKGIYWPFTRTCWIKFMDWGIKNKCNQ